MKILLDNNVPAPLRRHLVGHDVTTAAKMGWEELKNGDLLDAAERDGFEVMVTGDKNLSYQQNLQGRTLALVVLPEIDWTVLRAAPGMLVNIAKAVNRAEPGSFEALAPKQVRRVRSRRLGLEP